MATEEQTLEELYREHYRPLVRMAALLLDDVRLAEDVVQDAFVQLHHAWVRVNDPAKRPAYLRSTVLNGARSTGRRRTIGRRLEVVGATEQHVSTEAEAIQHESRREVVAALRGLPPRQRECLVLRYYLDLSEAAIAETLDISAGSVKTHTHRGLAALERALEKTR